MLRVRQQDDRVAFDQLYHRHVRRVILMARRLGVLSHDAAENVALEAFISVWDQRLSYHPDRGSFAAWLQAIARSRSADHFRRRRFPTPMSDRLPEREVRDGPRPMEEELRHQLSRCIEELRYPAREVMTFTFFDELADSIIADRLRISAARVAGYRSESRAKLAECMRRHGYSLREE